MAHSNAEYAGLLMVLLSGSAAAQNFPAEQVEFFEKEIRPLFATQCYSCHSRDAKTKFAGLQLDSRAGLLKGSDAGPVVEPGRPDGSKLLRAVRGELPARMPPGGKLKEAEIASLEKWIRMGLPWPEEKAVAQPASREGFDLEKRRREHWVWQPVRKPEPPAVKDAAWPLQPTDRFVLSRLEEKGLRPAAPADRGTLIRRLSFDLTGLPPTPAEIEAFERDSSPEAYEKVVERLLDSPRFGEHWARHWMDLIRYSESHGSEGDPDVPLAWRYRDYVIRALNADVPYDQLIREHIAGDLLQKPRIDRERRTNESRLGVAHLRMVEHGFQPVDPWEDRVKWTDNQVDVFSKAFQGLTVSCARCHDHKFDAISQKDYYALYGILAGARPTQTAIDIEEELGRNREALAAKKKEIGAALAGVWKTEAAKLAEWLTRGGLLEAFEEEACKPGSPLAVWRELGGKRGEEFRKSWDALAARWRQDMRERREFNATHFRKAWDLRRGDYAGWKGHGVGLPAKPSAPGEFFVLPEGERMVSGIYPGGVYSHRLSAKHNAVITSPRFKIETDSISLRLLGGGFSFAQLIIENYAVPRAGIYHLRYSPKRDQMDWVRWDTSFWKGFTAYVEFATMADATHFILDEEDSRKKPKPEPKGDGRSYFGAQEVVFHDGKETPREESIPLAWLLEGDAPASAEELARRMVRLLEQAVEAWRTGSMTEEQAAYLDSFVRSGILSNSSAVGAAEYRALENEVPVPRRAPGLIEECAGDQALLVRGNHKNPGEPVARRYLSALESEPYENPCAVRLRLAEEVASADNPLTARVMVNRIWRILFGRGVVASVDNFGKLGDMPTHPELLDWLASRFVEDGWSIKKTVRMLATSRAYRMSSDVAEGVERVDPSNKLLSHMPVRRLQAEAIRDAVLAVSGQLDVKMHGPSVPVYYAHETGKTKGDKPKGPLDGAGRRSVYLEIRRNATNPFLDVFDFPKPSTTRGERDLTNVPAQSLAMMNSPFVNEQARKWAEALAADGASSSGARVRGMFLRALGRAPSAAERDRAETFLAELAVEHAVSKDGLLGDARVWRDFALALFNLKEFMYIR